MYGFRTKRNKSNKNTLNLHQNVCNIARFYIFAPKRVKMHAASIGLKDQTSVAVSLRNINH